MVVTYSERVLKSADSHVLVDMLKTTYHDGKRENANQIVDIIGELRDKPLMDKFEGYRALQRDLEEAEKVEDVSRAERTNKLSDLYTKFVLGISA